MTTAAQDLHRLAVQCDACSAPASWTAHHDDRDIRLCGHHFQVSRITLLTDGFIVTNTAKVPA